MWHVRMLHCQGALMLPACSAEHEKSEQDCAFLGKMTTDLIYDDKYGWSCGGKPGLTVGFVQFLEMSICQ